MTTTTQPEPVFKRGDVALVLFPNSDLISAKTRPALIVQADGLQTELPQIIHCDGDKQDVSIGASQSRDDFSKFFRRATVRFAKRLRGCLRS